MFAEDDGLCDLGGQPPRIQRHMDRNVRGGLERRVKDTKESELGWFSSPHRTPVPTIRHRVQRRTIFTFERCVCRARMKHTRKRLPSRLNDLRRAWTVTQKVKRYKLK